MKSEIFDIAIVGSGLSSYTALLYLLEKKIHLKKKICIIAGDDNQFSKFTKSDISYLKRFHKVIFEKKLFNEIDEKFLYYAKKNNNSLIYLKSLGGLSKYWGGGFFPFDLLDQNEDIKKFIMNRFKFSNPNKFNYFGIKNIKKEFVKSLEVRVLTSPEKQHELLSPGIEMEKLCKIYNIRLIQNAIVDKLTFSKNICFNFAFDDYKIKSEYLLLGAGAIGSPKILYNSGVLLKKNIFIRDHLLYRIPLLNLSNFFNLNSSCKIKKLKRDSSLSSLKQAFTFRVLDRNLFLGLYSLDLKKIKVNRFLKFLINKKILIFSQIYVGNGLGEFKLPISLDFKKRRKYKVNFNFLSLKEWREIALFFISNNLFPIPFKYRTKFGSSYHTFGSLVDEIDKLNWPKFCKDKVYIIDSSVLKEIDSEPTSFRLIKNTINNVDKFLMNLELDN